MLSPLARIGNFFMAIVMVVMGLLFTGQLPPRQMPQPELGPYTQYVNPFIGTGAIPWAGGMGHPGAVAPFGRVHLCPDTTWAFGLNMERFGTSGYYYAKTHTFGFSHTRIHGSGLVDGGLFRITPQLGSTNPPRRLQRPLLFSHEKEVAVPGYYGVWLPEIATLAEMTATVRTGVHRYTFNSGRDAMLTIDATSNLRNDPRPGSIRVIDEYTIEGEMRDHAYFRAEFSEPFTAVAWADGKILADATKASGEEEAGVTLNFGNLRGQPLTVWLGMSYASMEGARANLAAESSGVDFDDVYNATRDAWDERLGSIDIKSSDREVMTVFYSSMYRAMVHPTNYTDVDSVYRAFGNTRATAEGFTYRSDLSLWDTFRSTHTLYGLIAPDIQHDSIQSLLAMAELHGAFPRWPRMGGEGGSMFGNPAHVVIAEAYLKGQLSDEDALASLEIMRNTVFRTVPEGLPNRGRDFGEEYIKYGYVPTDTGRISVSRTLEYAWADWAVANMASAMGPAFAEDEAVFRDLGYSFKNVFCPEVRYFRGRNAAGEWQIFTRHFHDYYDEIVSIFIPVAFSEPYSEGSPRHYRMHAVQDPQWLVESIGGEEVFVRELDIFMKDAARTRAALDPGSGWWVGNQHNYHAPFMFIEARRPDLTQQWVRWTLANRFADREDGLDGNDDLGALSAWYILNALGFFPVVGSDRYWIGSPAVDQATLLLDGGYELRIVAHNQSARNVYVQSVTFNGEPIEGWSFTHDLIAKGGTMEFTMGRRPA